jgi:hypothetical protein
MRMCGIDPPAVPAITRCEFNLLPQVQQDRFQVYALAGMLQIIDDSPTKGSP